MSIKVAQNDLTRNIKDMKWKTPLQKLPKNVRNLGKLIVAKGFKSCPKCKKSPNLVTLFPNNNLEQQKATFWFILLLS